MEKKKFKNTKIGKVLKNLAPNIFNIAGDLTGIEMFNKVGDLVRGDKRLTESDKQQILKELEIEKELYIRESKEITKRWESDNKTDVKITKLIRPLTLGFLTFVISLISILDSSNIDFKVPKVWIELYKQIYTVVIVSYFGSRGYEKVTSIKNSLKNE